MFVGISPEPVSVPFLNMLTTFAISLNSSSDTLLAKSVLSKPITKYL